MTVPTTSLLCCAAASCLAFASLAANGTEAAPEVESDPYLLAKCPISGRALGPDAVAKTIEGREVRFCCGGCPGRFEADTTKYFKEIDKVIVERQMHYYPLDTCVVMGDALVEDGEDIAVNYVYGNRLVRLCCKGCIKDLKEEPEKYLKKLDEAVIKAQGAHYPLENCIVLDDSKLGSMGDPVEIVVANRLVKFCCGRCESKFGKDPATYVARLDAAWKAAHESEGHDGDGHDHDGPDHDHDHDHDGHDHDGHDHGGS